MIYKQLHGSQENRRRHSVGSRDGPTASLRRCVRPCGRGQAELQAWRRASLPSAGADSVQECSPRSPLPPQHFYGPKTVPLRGLLQPALAKPVSLILYNPGLVSSCMTPPLRSVLYNKHTELLNGCGFSNLDLRAPSNPLILSVCLSVLSSLPPHPVRPVISSPARSMASRKEQLYH